MAPPRPEIYDQDVHESDGIHLPARGTGRRRTRDGAPQVSRGRSRPRTDRGPGVAGRTQRQARRVWRGATGWVVPLVVLVASVAGIYYLATERFGDDGDQVEGEVLGDGAVALAEPGPAALIVHLDDGGRALSFTLFALDDGPGGTVVLLPAATMVEIPGFGLDQLATAVDRGGVELAELTLRNLLSVDFAHVVSLSDADLTALNRTLGSVQVDNPSRLDRTNADGRVEVLYPAGPVDVAAADVGEFLSERAIDETDLERLVRHQRFWSSYLVARQSIVGVVDDPGRDVDSFLDEAAVRADELDYRILPVETLGGPEELYRIDAGGLVDLVALLAPQRSVEAGERVRVQVLNGVGQPGLAEPVTNLLLPTGAIVQLTGNALDFDHDVTQIVYYRDEHIESALRIRDELGVGEVVKQRDPIDVVDITVVVGADLAALVQP